MPLRVNQLRNSGSLSTRIPSSSARATTSVARAPMQPSAFERDEPRLIERPQGAAAALLRDATQAGSQPAGPSRSHGSASSSVPGASAGAQMYLCGGACGSMLEMASFSKAQLKKLRKGGQGSVRWEFLPRNS